MSMPNDSEQRELTEWEDRQEKLRSKNDSDGPITEKTRAIIDKVVDVLDPFFKKVGEHDHAITTLKQKQDRLKRGLLGAVKD